MNDDELLDHLVDRLRAVPGVEAVALGGSRATGTERPDSDWDLGVYYRGRLDTDAIRGLGWEGHVGEPGGWGGGVFNGGAWLRVDGRAVDLIYRDLDDVEHHLAEARAGRFRTERLSFYVANVPTYVVVGELATNRVLHGRLPRPEYPDALSAEAARRWHEDALLSVGHATEHHARRGDVTATAALLGCALLQEAHSRLAARKEWVHNEKGLVGRAGLRGLPSDLTDLGAACEAVRLEIGC